MKIRLHTTTESTVHETWEIDVPDELSGDVLRDPANVMRYIAVDADIAVRPLTCVQVAHSRVFDAAEPSEPEYVGKHRAGGD